MAALCFRVTDILSLVAAVWRLPSLLWLILCRLSACIRCRCSSQKTLKEESGGMSARLKVLLRAVHDVGGHHQKQLVATRSHPQIRDGLCVHAQLLLLPSWTAGSPVQAHTTPQQRPRPRHRHDPHCMLSMWRTFLRPGVWLNLYGTRSDSSRALSLLTTLHLPCFCKCKHSSPSVTQ